MSDFNKLLFDIDSVLWVQKALRSCYLVKADDVDSENVSDVTSGSGPKKRTPAALNKETEHGIYDKKTHRLRWRNFNYHWIKISNKGTGKKESVPAAGGGTGEDWENIKQPGMRAKIERAHIGDLINRNKLELREQDDGSKEVILNKKHGPERLGRIVPVEGEKDMWRIEKDEQFQGKRERQTWNDEPGIKGEVETLRRLFNQIQSRRYENRAKNDPNLPTNTDRVQQYLQRQEQKKK